MLEGEPIGLLLLITLTIPITSVIGLSLRDTEEDALGMNVVEESGILLMDVPV